MLLDLASEWKMAQAARLIEQQPKSVVFVSSLLRARELKMATALRSIGWKVILLYRQTTPISPGDFFDVVVRVSSDDELHRAAADLQPRLCHVFSGAVDELLLRFCCDKPAPVVIDLNDVFCPSLFNYLHDRFEPTRECLEKADGICARDLQPKFAERYDQFKIPQHSVLFAEYSWQDGPADPRATRKIDPNEIHVVSVGTICLETQGMYDSCYLQLARMMAEQKIHLHIYPHWFYRNASGSAFNFNLKADFRDFFRLQQETPYVHVHESLPLDQLARELPQYDFGIISGGAPAFGQKLGFLTEKYMRACYSGRIADYLDARLPILINREVGFNYWLLERYGIAVDLAGLLHPGFRDELLAIKRDRIRAESVRLAARKLSISAQANRLANFYEDLVSEKQPRALRLPYWMKAAKRISRVERPQRKFARKLDAAVPSIQAMLDKSRAENVSQTTSAQVCGQDEYAGMETGQPSKSRKALRKLALTLPPLRRIVHERDAYALQARQLRGQVRQLTGELADLRMQNVGLQMQLETLHTTRGALEARIGGLHNEMLEGTAIHEIAGLLNWPAIVDDFERDNGFTELLRLMQLWSRHGLRTPCGRDGTIKNKQTSAAWQLLNRKNLDQLLRDGHRNFKRTIALNYFTFPIQAGDPQIASLEAKLDPADIEGCWRVAQSLPNDPGFDLPDQLHYRYVVLLLWTYARRIDRQKCLDRLKEPAQGNPVLVPIDGQAASQDMANSVIEYYSMREGVAFERCRRVLEIGAGYGRNAQVILELHRDIQYTIIDIPPALYVAQRYLSSLFRDRPIFRVSDFTSYKEVQEELEHSSIVFLLPHQMALLPDRHFNLTLNISSFGELTREEIDYYFAEVDRVTEGHLYTKQWMQSKNPFDGLVLTEADYPVRPHWRKIYSRACAVQSDFFEALYEVGDHA